MTKKQTSPSAMLNRHHSQRLPQLQGQGPGSMIKKQNIIKKSLKKPQLPLQIEEKVDGLSERSEKFYRNVGRKIDRMIEIIEEIEQKHLADNSLSTEAKNEKNGSMRPQFNGQFQNNESDHQRFNENNVVGHHVSDPNGVVNQKDSTLDNNQQLVSKTLTHLHNLLTYEKPLSHIKHEFESFYSKLSVFAKQLEEQRDLPEDKRFLLPEEGLDEADFVIIRQLIKQHYLRQGNFEAAKLFNEEYQLEGEDSMNYKGRKNSSKIQIQPEEADRNIPSEKSIKNNNQKNSKKKTKTSTSPSKSHKPKAQLVTLQQNFIECLSIGNDILKKKFDTGINWCVEERLYETCSNTLEYDLRVCEVKVLVAQKKFRQAFIKLEQGFQKFIEVFEEDISKLIGFVLSSCNWNEELIFSKQEGQSREKQFKMNDEITNSVSHQLVSQRYSSFHISTVNLIQLSQQFTSTYFVHYDISKFNTLQLCYQVGKKYEEKYFSCISMFVQKDRQQFLKHKRQCQYNDKHTGLPHAIILPFQIPVQNQYMHHSIFVCPVTKQVLSSNDGVEYLSCGHLVSESAKKNMAEVRRSNHKQKCPVCQKDRAADVVKVRF